MSILCAADGIPKIYKWCTHLRKHTAPAHIIAKQKANVKPAIATMATTKTDQNTQLHVGIGSKNRRLKH